MLSTLPYRSRVIVEVVAPRVFRVSFKKKSPQNPKRSTPSKNGSPYPWARLEALIDPHCPKAGNGRRSCPLESMQRVHCLHNVYLK